jgi:hypothetical protein
MAQGRPASSVMAADHRKGCVTQGGGGYGEGAVSKGVTLQRPLATDDRTFEMRRIQGSIPDKTAGSGRVLVVTNLIQSSPVWGKAETVKVTGRAVRPLIAAWFMFDGPLAPPLDIHIKKTSKRARQARDTRIGRAREPPPRGEGSGVTCEVPFDVHGALSTLDEAVMDWRDCQHVKRAKVSKFKRL